MTPEPSRYVQPRVSDARVDRLWRNLSERLERPRARVWPWLVLAGALSSAAVLGLFWAKSAVPAGRDRQALLTGTRLETKSDALAVTLNDGSRVLLSARSELTVHGNEPAAVALSLRRGRLDCDISHREGRSFTVTVDDVEVRVVGTKFSVEAAPEAAGTRVEVSVARGVVEVRSARRPNVVARVAAGESFSQASRGVTAEGKTSPSLPSAPLPAELEPPTAGSPGPSASPTASASGPPSAGAAGARELFERAGDRRRAGDATGAAQAYEQLLRLYPNDARASLSAFELGRLRMDRLGDPSGAISALERAVALNVGPTFREDALARLVSVYAAQGSFRACERARDRYLADYPNGVHAAAVGTRCGTR